MNPIKATVYLSDHQGTPPMDVVYGSDVPIELTVGDVQQFPEDSTAAAYANEFNTHTVYVNQGAVTVTGNKIKFTPDHGFFSPGDNFLVVKVRPKGDTGDGYPFPLIVHCHPNPAWGTIPANPVDIKGYAEQAKASAEQADRILKDIEKNYPLIPQLAQEVSQLSESIDAISDIVRNTNTNPEMDVTNGFIDLTGGYGASNGRIRCNTFIRCLRGSTIAVDAGYKFRVAMYSGNTPETFIRNNTNTFVTGMYTIPEDCYIRFTVANVSDTTIGVDEITNTHLRVIDSTIQDDVDALRENTAEFQREFSEIVAYHRNENTIDRTENRRYGRNGILNIVQDRHISGFIPCAPGDELVAFSDDTLAFAFFDNQKAYIAISDSKANIDSGKYSYAVTPVVLSARFLPYDGSEVMAYTIKVPDDAAFVVYQYPDRYSRIKDIITINSAFPTQYVAPQQIIGADISPIVHAKAENITDFNERVLEVIGDQPSIDTVKVRSGKPISVRIPNSTNAVVPDATIRLALHRGDQDGDVRWNEVFCSDFNPCFDGVRMFDGTKEIPYYILSRGNYDFIKDANLRYTYGLRHFSDGVLIKMDASTHDVSYSCDLGHSWKVQGFRGAFMGIVDSSDRLYYIEQGSIRRANRDGSGVITILTKAAIEESQGVANVMNIPSMRWCIGKDSDGMESVFMGYYAGEQYDPETHHWTPHAQIYRIRSNEDTMQLVYDNPETPHVHRMYADNSVVPSVIYAGCDNSAGPHGPFALMSSDMGTTWVDISDRVPFRNRDYGFTYAKGNYGISGGEMNILGGETLYKVTESNCEVVLPTHQGVRAGISPDYGKSILIAGVAANSNGIAQIYRSTDDGSTWTTVFADDAKLLTASTAGDGFRDFTDYFIPAGSYEPMLIGTADSNVDYGLRCYFGGNRYYALCYVKVGDIPVGGKTITIDPNYLIAHPDVANVISDNAIAPAFRIPLNEGIGAITRTTAGDVNISGVLSAWEATNTSLFGGMMPSPVRNAYGVKTKRKAYASVGMIPINKIKDFSVSFWLKITDDFTTNTDVRFIASNDDFGIAVRAGKIRLTNFGAIMLDIGIPMGLRLCAGTYQMFTLTVNNDDATKVTLYMYDNMQSSATRSGQWFAGSIAGSNWGIGRNQYTDIQDVYPGIADIRFYDHCLTDAEVRTIHHGCNLAIIN